MAAETSPPTTGVVTFKKATYAGRFDVFVDGIRAGWVVKRTSYNRITGKEKTIEWAFYAPVDITDPFHGKQLGLDRTRRDATMNGMSKLDAYHSGHIVISEALKDEWAQVDGHAAFQFLLHQKYPGVA